MMANLPMIVVGNVAAFIAGILAVGFLLKYLARHDLRVFGWYRVGLAAFVVIMLLVQSS